MSSGYPILDSAKKIEEERMSAYKRGLYYPVKLGDVFQSRYQVISKLGFGQTQRCGSVVTCSEYKSTLLGSPICS